MFCSKTQTIGASTSVSFVSPGYIEVRRRESPQLALEFQIIGDLLFLGELIDEVNGGRKLALKLIAGLNADDILPGLAPLAVRILDGAVFD